jgi:hypothetical protein
MSKLPFVLSVLLVLPNVWGKTLSEQEIENGLWRVQYRHEATINGYKAYRKATCDVIRLARDQGYSYLAIQDPWLGLENWPPPRGYTRYLIYRLEATVRFSNEPIVDGLPHIDELEESMMCGKWTIAYVKDAQSMGTLRNAWGDPERVQTFFDVYGTQEVSIELSRPPDEVEMSLDCRLRSGGTVSWEVFDPAGNIVWAGSSENSKLHEELRFPGAAGKWRCSLNLDPGLGVCRLLIGAGRSYRRMASEDSYSRIIGQLKSPNSKTRTQASQDVFGRGVRYKPIYDYLEQLILQAGAGKTLEFGTPDEIAWHMKALASSGSRNYVETLNRMRDSKNKRVAKYAKQSLQILQRGLDSGFPYLDPAKVRLIDVSSIDICTFVKQEDCKGTGKQCIALHQSRAAALGADAILILTHVTGSDASGQFVTDAVADYYSCYSPELIAGDP